MKRNSDYRRNIVAKASALGFECRVTNGDHLAFRHPGGGATVYGPSTPGDWRSIHNTLSKLRRVARSVIGHA